MAVRPFEPHADLDGVTFSSFDDAALANSDTWPSVEYFIPGDHVGCTCDFLPLWVLPTTPDDVPAGDES